MQKFKTLNDAIALAEFAHRNQQDKAGLPYIEHPKRVLASVQARGALPFVQMAAVLHDVTEDTPFTREMLESLGFSEAVTHVVWELDRGNGREGDDYYLLMSDEAALIKDCDIADNLLPWRQSYLSSSTQIRLELKYSKARELLWQRKVKNAQR
jgi:hypothetical protein